MENEHLATYLNDHLAGSVMALELLEKLEAEQAGTALERFLAELRTDITADQQELETLMERLKVARSVPRRMAAWITEKFSELKLRLDDPAHGALRLLESLEVLVVGIEGKRALWRALEAAAQAEPALRGTEYARLAQRAEEQHDRVELARLDAAKAALGVAPYSKEQNR
jgi:hypothetical protein